MGVIVKWQKLLNGRLSSLETSYLYNTIEGTKFVPNIQIEKITTRAKMQKPEACEMQYSARVSGVKQQPDDYLST